MISRASFPQLSYDLLLSNEPCSFLERHLVLRMLQAILALITESFREVTKTIDDWFFLPCQACERVLSQSGAATLLTFERDLGREFEELPRFFPLVLQCLALRPCLSIQILKQRPGATWPCKHHKVGILAVNVLMGLHLSTWL